MLKLEHVKSYPGAHFVKPVEQPRSQASPLLTLC